MKFDDGQLLRIYLGESDHHEGMPRFEWLVQKAKESGLRGATVLRAMEGFGAHSHLHTARLLALSSDLPVVVEIVDTAERIAAFLPTVEAALKDGLVTLENVRMRQFSTKPSGERGDR